MSKYTGAFPNVITYYTHDDVIAEMKAWAKEIASDNRYIYKHYGGDKRTHQCPVCHPELMKESYGKYPKGIDGWNCIGLAFAIWHHGGHLKSKCNCGVISNDGAEKILKAKTHAEAVKLAQKYCGLKDIDVIRNNGKVIPKSKVKAGDIGMLFNGSKYEHTFFVMSSEYVADSTGSGSDANNIRANRKFEGRYTSKLKLIVRYTGNGTQTRKYMKMGDSGEEVKKLQKILNWAMNSNLEVDGDFGIKTDTAVRAFQTKCGITASGHFGEKSLEAAKNFNKVDVNIVEVKTKWKGADVSTYQNKISIANFKKAKANGIDYVILRLGYTGSVSKQPTLDKVFEHNYTSATAAGLPVGVYYYSLATTTAMAKKEAEFVINKLKGKNISYPVYIDMEDDTYQGKCSKKTLASVCNTFCKTVKNAGYLAGVYANRNWFNNKIGTITADHTKWVAQYASKCTYKGKYDMWQYSSSAKVIGISNKTDVSWCYKDFTKVAKPIPIIAQNVKTIDTIAQEVIDGKWGSGKTRKQKLTEAGYDYNEVQDRVNEILASKKK